MSTKWDKEHMHPCLDCGKPIHPDSTRCPSCAQRYRWKTGGFRKTLRGAECPWWKGGRRIAQGYVMILKPGHPRAAKNNYVPEHILVWEEFHKKPVPDGYIIHHLNGIKHDNRPKNLVALPRKSHTSWTLIDLKNKRIQELESLLNGQGQLI